MGTLYKNDLEIYRKFFKEQAKLIGIHVQYQYPIDLEYTLHGTEDPKGYSEPEGIDIIFDQSPKLKTLKKLGWVSEDPSDKPYICQVAFDVPNLQKGCLITLPVPLPLVEDKVFRITEITMDQIFPDSYYCKLVPKMRKMNTIKPEKYNDKSYQFLKVDEDAT